MDAWTDLWSAVAELRARNPTPVKALSGRSLTGEPEGGRIELYAWASAVAAQLHDRFGDRVHLVVGALSYPDRRVPASPVSGRPPRRDPRWPRTADLPPVDPDRMVATLAWPVTVRSGYSIGGQSTTQPVRLGDCALLVRNLTGDRLDFFTGPWLVGEVVDRETGTVVGRCVEPVPLVRVGFTVPPHGTAGFPLRVCTESINPDLGYAVPPGDWGVQTTLNELAGAGDTGTGTPYRTPILPLTIVA